MGINIPAAYCDVFDQLVDLRYVVVGGVAVVLHGHERPIYDLDIVVPPLPEEQNRVLHALLLAGFAPSLPLPLNLLTVMRLFDQSAREIDVFANFQIPFDELWTDSVELAVGTSVARVTSLEHLLQAKRKVGGAYNLTDVEGLLARLES